MFFFFLQYMQYMHVVVAYTYAVLIILQDSYMVY